MGRTANRSNCFTAFNEAGLDGHSLAFFAVFVRIEQVSPMKGSSTPKYCANSIKSQGQVRNPQKISLR